MEERIHYLYKQYLENRCSRQEFDEFFSYLQQAEHNELIRKLISETYAGSDRSLLTYVDEDGHLVLPEPQWFSPSPSRSRRKSLLVAACFFLLLSAGIFWWLKPRREAPAQAAALALRSTGRSEYKYLLLPDSTQVWLNAASKLEFPAEFEGAERSVYLSGEAYFDVKHADRIPFIIHTGKVSTKVLGTAFNIRAYPGLQHIVVSVSRGKVQVNYEDKVVALLGKGQQVKLDSQSQDASEKPIASEQVAAWQQGNLIYEDERLSDILSDLERVYNVQIRMETPSLGSLQVSTSFKKEIGVEQALQVLCRLTDTELVQKDGRYLVR